MASEYRLLDDDPMVIQKTLNQWAHQYDLVLHNPKYLHKECTASEDGVYCAQMTVMVQRTKI